MTRIRFLVLLIMGLWQPLSAQTTDTLPHALLWEIRGPGMNQPSYLFGTIHMIPKDQFDLPDQLLARLAPCDRLVLELDMDKATNVFSQLKLIPKMMMPDGLRIADLVSEPDYLLIRDAIDKAGLPGLMERVKPLFLSALLDPALRDGGGGESYDLTLWRLAKANDIDHSGLETVSQQLAAFDAIPLEDQARMLVDQLRDTSAQTIDLIRAYKDENLNLLAASMESEADTSFLNVLLYDRNRSWIPIMTNLMKTERVFFAVGAGHLAGDHGVVRLLERAGYEMKGISIFK